MERNDIKFKSGSSKLERGAGNGTPKISVQIKGEQPRWKAVFRGDCPIAEMLQDKVTEFLESDEVKDYIIEQYKVLEVKREEREAQYSAPTNGNYTGNIRFDPNWKKW